MVFLKVGDGDVDILEGKVFFGVFLCVDFGNRVCWFGCLLGLGMMG